MIATLFELPQGIAFTKMYVQPSATKKKKKKKKKKTRKLTFLYDADRLMYTSFSAIVFPYELTARGKIIAKEN